MFRLWAKIWKDNHMLRDTVIENDRSDTRTHKVYGALEEACTRFDLSVPLWLDKNYAEFRRHSKTRFSPDCFVESVDFDYLEIQMIEED